MNNQQAMAIFDSLSQESRLNAFRLLVKAGPDGLSAGSIGNELGIAHNTLSFHMSHLINSGIVHSRRQGRSVIYSANYAQVSELIKFLVRDCCSPEFVSVRKNDGQTITVIEQTDCC